MGVSKNVFLKYLNGICWRWGHNVLETKCTKSAVKSLLSLSFFLLAFMTSKESFIWSEHAQLYENEQKKTKNSIVETTRTKKVEMDVGETGWDEAKDTQASGQKGKQKKINKQTNRLTDKKTNEQKDTQTYWFNRQTDQHSNKGNWQTQQQRSGSKNNDPAKGDEER